MTREIEYTYISICPECRIEIFSTESPEEMMKRVGLKKEVCMNCDNKVQFEYIGSIGNKKKRYPVFKVKLAFWNLIRKIKERVNGLSIG